jgi:hypothetical protein
MRGRRTNIMKYCNRNVSKIKKENNRLFYLFISGGEESTGWSYPSLARSSIPLVFS